MEPTPRQIDLMSHALGAAYFYKQKGFYRNYFCANPGTEDDLEWTRMVEQGLALCCEKDYGRYHMYVVTAQGETIVREHLRATKAKEPKVSRSKKRYRVWLDIAETIDENYGQWLKNPAWNDYRREKGV